MRDRTLWLANDELATVERHSTTDGARYGAHQPFRLGDYFELPGGSLEQGTGIGADVFVL